MSDASDKRAQQQLADVERLVNVGLWEWQPGTGTVTWSPQLRVIFRQPLDVVPSYELWLAFVHPDDRDAVGAALFRAVQEREPFDFEHRVLHEDGTVRHVRCRGTVHVAPDGSPERVLGATQDITDYKSMELRLRHLAEHDPLTGLANRCRLENALAEHAVRWTRHGEPGAILLLDLDNFKDVNDTRGHATGDAVVVRLAQIMGERVRESDLLARIGGDEFAILLTAGDEPGAVAVAEALLAAIRREAVVVEGGTVRMTASVGIAVAASGGPDAELLAEAEVALDDAKDQGRDRVVVSAGTTRAALVLRIGWADRLRSALERDALELHAQPICEACSGGVVRHELLVRLCNDDGTLAPPGAFLPAAERHGLVADLDRWVVARAARLVAQEARVGRDTCVSVNLSGRTVGVPGIADELLALLSAAGADPRRMMFEVTETAAIDRLAAAAALAGRLRESGATFALDDFGAGFSSFTHLKALPVDAVKVDGGFVRGCLASATDRVVVRSLVEVARTLGKQTIVECVEDQATQDLLTGFGADLLQGFHLGRPVALRTAFPLLTG